ncbi:MAG: response regulator [Pseudomonadota bacterium]
MSSRKSRILLVEDDRLAQKVTSMILRQLDCMVDIVDHGIDALASLDKNKYHLIFMDLGLPDLDGFTLTKTIRQFKDHPKHQVPIIALTAHLEEAYRKKGFEAGLTDFLEKPLTLRRAQAMVDQYVLKQL